MIDLIRLILEQQGYSVRGFTSGEEGLAAAIERAPDLILLDLMMPRMDGWEVLRRIRKEPDLATTPVVLLTAKAQGIDKMLGLHVARVDDYVTKPFGPQELIDRVATVLAAHTPGS
jgi:DNA-binding response OmpR family regulator